MSISTTLHRGKWRRKSRSRSVFNITDFQAVKLLCLLDTVTDVDSGKLLRSLYFWFFTFVVNADLLWLESDRNTKLMRKDCINAFIGGIRDDGSNIVIDWIRDNKVQQVPFLLLSLCVILVLKCPLLEAINQL